MTNKCEICKNKEFCKYNGNYEQLFKKLSGLCPTFNYFNIELDCKYFKENFPACSSNKEINELVKQYEKTKPSSFSDTILWKTNSCEGCPTYERLKRGEFVVGDQCTFCQNSPTKVTCGDTPESLQNISTCSSTQEAYNKLDEVPCDNCVVHNSLRPGQYVELDNHPVCKCCKVNPSNCKGK